MPCCLFLGTISGRQCRGLGEYEVLRKCLRRRWVPSVKTVPATCTRQIGRPLRLGRLWRASYLHRLWSGVRREWRSCCPYRNFLLGGWSKIRCLGVSHWLEWCLSYHRGVGGTAKRCGLLHRWLNDWGLHRSNSGDENEDENEELTMVKRRDHRNWCSKIRFNQMYALPFRMIRGRHLPRLCWLTQAQTRWHHWSLRTQLHHMRPFETE